MKYQRVLYTRTLTTEIRSKLRIVSYEKRRSIKNNVYFVGFASDTDVKIADRRVKRLRNVTLKPIQSLSTDIQHVHQLGSNTNPQISSPTTSVQLLSPPNMLSFLPCAQSTLIESQNSSVKVSETLGERACRILGPLVAFQQDHGSLTPVQPAKSVCSSSRINHHPPHTNVNTGQKDRREILDSVQSCLKTIKLGQEAADRICELHRRGIGCREATDDLFRVHSTAFYCKATVCAQIKAAASAGLRVPWSDVTRSIRLLEADIHHQQSFMTRTASKYVSSKIDSRTSIAMSSKLAYQLAKLSN